ncbi:hypothetical protein [Saccharopolyspora hattusasensis]|uniref:hypothetical protein n=1 Tax=Saccharopolyspora hattusasensis TaxID=1128679 RepID=UPI003D99943C
MQADQDALAHSLEFRGRVQQQFGAGCRAAGAVGVRDAGEHQHQPRFGGALRQRVGLRRADDPDLAVDSQVAAERAGFRGRRRRHRAQPVVQLLRPIGPGRAQVGQRTGDHGKLSEARRAVRRPVPRPGDHQQVRVGCRVGHRGRYRVVLGDFGEVRHQLGQLPAARGVRAHPRVVGFFGAPGRPNWS